MDKMEKSVGTMFSWLAPKENSERSTLERKQSERRSARKSEGDEVNWAFSSLDEFEEFLKNFTNAASIAKEFATKPHWYHIIRIAFDEGEDLLDWVDKIINYDGELVSLTAACSEEGEQSSFECFQYNVLHFIAYMGEDYRVGDGLIKIRKALEGKESKSEDSEWDRLKDVACGNRKCPVHFAAMNGDKEVLKILSEVPGGDNGFTKNGAYLLKPTVQGKAALEYAVRHKHMDTARWLVTKEVPTAGDFHDDDWVADMMLTDQGHHEALVKVLCDDDSVAFAHTQFCYDLCAQFARGKDNKMMVCRKMVAIAQAAAAVGRQSALSDKELSERAFELNSTIQTGIGVLIDACGGTEKAYQLIISEHGMKMVLAAVQGDCQVALAKHSFQSAIDFLWLGGLFNALHTGKVVHRYEDYQTNGEGLAISVTWKDQLMFVACVPVLTLLNLFFSVLYVFIPPSDEWVKTVLRSIRNDPSKENYMSLMAFKDWGLALRGTQLVWLYLIDEPCVKFWLWTGQSLLFAVCLMLVKATPATQIPNTS